jgi:hypothetical protein
VYVTATLEEASLSDLRRVPHAGEVATESVSSDMDELDTV